MVISNRRLTCLMLLLCLLEPAFFSAHAMASEMSTLKQLSGEDRDDRQKVMLCADGRFTWEAIYVPSGTDTGMGVTASGKARLDAGSISMAIDERSLVTALGGLAPSGAKALL